MRGDSTPQTRRASAANAAERNRTGVKKNRPQSGDRSDGSLPRVVGALFRSAREAQRLSQHQVAALTEGRLSRATVSDIERGRNLPGVESLLFLSRALHVDPAEVLERVELDASVPTDLTGLSLEDLMQRALDRHWDGDYRGALAVYDAMSQRLLLAPPEDEGERRRWLARVEISRAVSLRRCSALRAAEAAAKRGTRVAAGFPDLQARAYMVLASLHSHESLDDLAEVSADRAIGLSEACGSRIRGQAWNQKGLVLLRTSRFEEARQALLRARKFLREAKDGFHLVRVEGNIGACLLGLGRPLQARRRFAKAVELARRHADPAMEASWLIDLGRLALDSGEIDEADRMAVAALKISRPREQLLTVFRAEWLRHLAAREIEPHSPDRRRLARLKKLYPRVSEQKVIHEIVEFEAQVMGRSEKQEDKP